MNNITEESKFIEILKRFEECLESDKEMYNPDRYNMYKYGISLMKDYLKEDFHNFHYFKNYNSVFSSAINHFEMEFKPYDSMILSDLKSLMDVYVFNINMYRAATVDRLQITKVFDNPEQYNYIYQDNRYSPDNSFAGRITNHINRNILLCKVPEGEKIRLVHYFNGKERESIFNEGEEFFFIARKGIFTIPTITGEDYITDKNDKELNYKTVGGFIYPKIIHPDEKLKISCQSPIEDIMEMNRFNNFPADPNIHVPLHWIKKQYIRVTFNYEDHFIPINIGSENHNNIQNFLLSSKKNHTDLELLTMVYNEYKLKDEQIKYLIDNDFSLIYHIKELSDKMKEYIIELGKFNQNERLYRELNLQQSERLDELFLKSGADLKFLNKINYEPEPESIKKFLELDGSNLEHVKNKSPELYEIALRSRGTALRFIKDQTLELCKLAVENDKKAIKYVKSEFLKETEEYLNSLTKKNKRNFKP